MGRTVNLPALAPTCEIYGNLLLSELSHCPLLIKENWK